MEGWKEYVLEILTVSLCCRILQQILPEHGGEELLHLVSGVLLTVVLLQPLTKLRLNDFLDLQQYLPESPDYLLAAGKETADVVKRQYINDRYEAYILDKAKAMGADILPEIQIDSSGIPVAAQIQGCMDPQIQNQLEKILITDMGITKENQQWTGNPENGN